MSEFFSNVSWVGKECLKIFYNPVGVVGGLLDAFRGWKFSRNWITVWFNLPTVLLLSSVFIAYAVSLFSRNDSQVQRFSVESEGRCPTKSLESIYNQTIDPEFSKAISIAPMDIDARASSGISELTMRYVELLSKRIISIESGNQIARYRLSLIHKLANRLEQSQQELNDLSNGLYGDFPVANAWVAKRLIIEYSIGNNKLLPDIMTNLHKASQWKDVDYRILVIYARLLEQTNDLPKAIAIAKQAAALKPELHLELARLFSKTGNQDGLRDSAFFVEKSFSPRLNTPLEKDTDRLAVAEAKKITGRLEEASQVLSEGLANNKNRPEIRRELSEVQRLIYLKSVKKTQNDAFTADLSLLEAATETDDENPNISSEIARLLPLKIKPTKRLVDALKKQNDAGLTSASAFRLLAEGYYALGNPKEAIRNWELSLLKEPDDVSAINNLALSIAKSSDKNLDRSLELLAKAQQLAPNSPEILDTLGEVLMMADRPKEAINKFELAIRLDNRRLTTRQKLKTAYEAIGMQDMAKVQSAVIESIQDQMKAEEKAKEEAEKAKAALEQVESSNDRPSGTSNGVVK